MPSNRRGPKARTIGGRPSTDREQNMRGRVYRTAKAIASDHVDRARSRCAKRGRQTPREALTEKSHDDRFGARNSQERNEQTAGELYLGWSGTRKKESQRVDIKSKVCRLTTVGRGDGWELTGSGPKTVSEDPQNNSGAWGGIFSGPSEIQIGKNLGSPWRRKME